MKLISRRCHLLSGTFDYAQIYLQYVWTHTHAHMRTHPSLTGAPPLLQHLPTLPTDTLTDLSVIKLSAYLIFAAEYFSARRPSAVWNLHTFQTLYTELAAKFVLCALATFPKSFERLHRSGNEPIRFVQRKQTWTLKWSVFLSHTNTFEDISQTILGCEWCHPLLFTAQRQEFILLVFAKLLLGHCGEMKQCDNQNTPVLPVLVLLLMYQKGLMSTDLIKLHLHLQ